MGTIQKIKYDLGFGNAVVVRQAFLNNYEGNIITFSNDTLSNFNYPPFEGDLELINITKQLIKKQIDKDYKYVMLTNGATGAICVALSALKSIGIEYCYTRNAPWYTHYPKIIEAAGMSHNYKLRQYYDSTVALIDMPSNPKGLLVTPDLFNKKMIIIDGVYLNKIYTNNIYIIPEHDIMIGSYSKLTGLNGSRIGWIATNKRSLYELLKIKITAHYCGISMASTEILKSMLINFNWDLFEINAKNYLNDNKEEMSKLQKYFDYTEIPENGMFYYVPIDKKCKELLTKSSVGFINGEKLGVSDSFGRLSLGQDRSITKNAIKSVLKSDKIN